MARYDIIEYKTIDMGSKGANDIEKFLNDGGKEGWELVLTIGNVACFKRIKKDTFEEKEDKTAKKNI